MARKKPLEKEVKAFDLARVALGELEADIAIINGTLVNVYTGELQYGDTILVKGDKIAYVGKNAQRSIGPNTRVIDTGGKTVVPGFIDTHNHMDWFLLPDHLIRYAMKGGTTTVIAEVDAIAFLLGYRGIVELIRAMNNQPIKIFISVPPMVTNSPLSDAHALSISEVRKLLRRKEVVALGESYWTTVVEGDTRILDLLEEAKKAGKKIEGHSAGARDNKLQAYTSLGITSCHEPTTADEVLERLRLGIHVLVREGEVRRELEEIARIKEETIDFRLMSLASDGPGPHQLLNNGYMEYVVQKAIDLGFSPVTAFQMASLNAAQRFGLDDYIGGIAPGKYADIVIIPDLKIVRADYVISKGKLVSEKGHPIGEPGNHTFPEWMLKTVHLPGKLTANDFAIKVDGAYRCVNTRIIDMVSTIVSREAIVELSVSDGRVLADKDRDIIKVAAIERIYEPGKRFVGFIRGLGIKSGAIATSTMWDTTDIGVVGADDGDMAIAVNRIKELNGGLVVCNRGKVIAEIALPVAGLFCTDPLEIMVVKLNRIQQAAADMGCTSPDIRLTLSVLSTAAIPFLRICESGLKDLKKNRLVDLIVE
ncbi:MAG: adenine deaminase C-terminal domain-containing protein [Dehalococcoidia bacterium]